VRKLIFLFLFFLLITTACNAAPAAAPTITPRPTAAGPAFRDFPSSMEGAGIAVVPGDYKFPAWFGFPLSMTVQQEGWRVVTLERAELLALIQGENSVGYATSWLTFLPVYDAEAEELFEKVIAAPNLTLIAGPETRTIGGYTVEKVVFTALPNPEFVETDESPAGVQPLDIIQEYAGSWTWLTSTPEAQIELIKMHIGERVLLVYIEAPQAEFESLAQQAEVVLAALEPLD
jgi:hypothetical protein